MDRKAQGTNLLVLVISACRYSLLLAGRLSMVPAMESDLLGAPPHCERCLVSMLVDGSTANPFWRCPACNLVRLA